jgi:predicted membrane metal-binding protein
LAATHERLFVDDEIKGSKDRTFGLTFAAVFLLYACWPLLRGRSPRWWVLAMGAAFAITALLVPRALAPLNRFWLRVGLLLNRITNPIVMGLLFVTTIIPLALMLRALGKTPLQLGRDPSASTYWIDRRPPGPAPSTMSRQF